MMRKRASEESDESDENVDLLPYQKWGRPVLLEKTLDVKVHMYLRRVQDECGVVTALIAVAAVRCILLSCDRLKLA